MEKQEQVNDHLDVAEFIDEVMEEERTGIKKEVVIKKVVATSKMISLSILKMNKEIKRLNHGRKHIKNRS
jgi:hypothetical protein